MIDNHIMNSTSRVSLIILSTMAPNAKELDTLSIYNTLFYSLVNVSSKILRLVCNYRKLLPFLIWLQNIYSSANGYLALSSSEQDDLII